MVLNLKFDLLYYVISAGTFAIVVQCKSGTNQDFESTIQVKCCSGFMKEPQIHTLGLSDCGHSVGRLSTKRLKWINISDCTFGFQNITLIY